MRDGFDIVVIGGGHAGCEAALAATRMGQRTLLTTLRRDRIGHMPCNPAVGGLAKGHLVRELDALGGEIAHATDRAAIQFRMLNRAKGPAVWSPRAQVDKVIYSRIMRETLEAQPLLTIVEDEVTELIVNQCGFAGVRFSDGSIVNVAACVLTTGTFLRGLMHTGDRRTDGGREGEPPASALSESLRALGLRMGRLKTGTPPRVFRDSVDLSKVEPQPGDDPPTPFSFRTHRIELPQVPCHLTYTTEATHDVIRRNLSRSPLYGGVIEGIGPRYCPSIEDKVVRFADKTRHQVFIEPEGLDHPELYLNGISTSLPVDVQLEILSSIPGLETARMARPGYAVEYDFFPPDQIQRTMESKYIAGLYFAGQVNGTSGYEEAAAQGFVAGVNAVLKLRGEAPFVPRRDEAYIGVLIDDLTTKEIDEPYRMFTSRAEFRLVLRQDNADERLMETGHRLGLVPARALDAVQARVARVARTVAMLQSTSFPAREAATRFAEWGLEPVRHGASLGEVLRRPGVGLRHLRELVAIDCPPALDESVECLVKYQGYIDRQTRDVQALSDMEARRIPHGFPFETVAGLSTEAREKLRAKQPETLAQASRIAGVRASDLSILAVHLERARKSSATG
jgi:tRNA uridine 5-carboxymethylaminomethyl modification enzyme